MSGGSEHGRPHLRRPGTSRLQQRIKNEPESLKAGVVDDLTVAICYGTATIFGAIHNFANHATCLVWSVSSVITTALPSRIVAHVYLNERLPHIIVLLSLWGLIGAYVAARGCIVGITFYSLSHMPAGM